MAIINQLSTLSLLSASYVINGVTSMTAPVSGGLHHRTPRVVHGAVMDNAIAPWFAHLTLFHIATDEEGNTGVITTSCGGSLIAPNKILTAAHCFDSHGDNETFAIDTFEFFDPITITVPNNLISLGDATTEDYVNGVFDRNRNSTDPLYTATKIECHPAYNEESLKNDICIVTLNATVTDIEPVKLSYEKKDITPDSFATVIGYGRLTYNGKASDELRRVSGPIVDNDFCEKIWDDVAGKPEGSSISNAVICVDNRRGDACQGDSGGPLLNEAEGVQIGLVSYGLPCPSYGVPSVYTSVAHYEQWIKKAVASE